MSSRRRRLSILSALYVGAILVALAAAAVLSARHGIQFDLTERKRHSLTESTKAILRSMPEGSDPVDMLAITSPRVTAGDPGEAVRQLQPLMSLFAATGRARTSVRLAESEPALVNELAIDRVPVILLSWQPPTPPGGEKPPRRERRTLVPTEDGVAQALRELVEDRKRIAYFLVGHDELRIGEAGHAGAALLAATLQGVNFETRELALAGSADIPQDADLVVVAGPQVDLLKEELAAFDRHAARGGRFLILDAPTRDPAQLILLHAWLSALWNLSPSEGVVADFEVPLGADSRILLVMPRDEHPIVSGMKKVLQLPLSRSIAFLDRPLDGVAVTAMLRSGERSWLETNLEERVPRYDEGEDVRGPLPLAWAGTRKPAGQAAESRLVVFGSRVAFADQALAAGGNMDLLRNCVDWLTGREADISARVLVAPEGTVVVSDRQGRIIIGSMLLLPAIVTLAGVATWWRRRRL